MGRTRVSSNSLLAKLGVFRPRRCKARAQQYLTRPLRFESLEVRQMLSITVDNPFDELDADRSPGDTSLREAIFDANPAGETIVFAPSLNGAKIDLNGALGEIAFAKNLTIDASMLSNGITIDAAALADPTPTLKDGNGIRIFNITGGSVTLKNLTLQGGDVFSFFGSADGGAIRAVGDVSLTLDSVTIRNNAAIYGRGGGLFFQTPETEHLTSPPPAPRLVIKDSLFQNNVAQDGGGANIDLGAHGISNWHPQALGQRAEITRSRFLGNTAQDRGGGLALWHGAGAEVEIVESTISGNVAGTLRTHGIPPGELRDSGGGVYSYLFSGDDPIGGGNPSDVDNGIAKLVISGSTVDNNISGTYGGGVAICAKRQDPDLTVRSKAAIVNSTISGNIVLRNGTEPGGGGALGKGGGVALAIYANDYDEGLDAHFENVTVTKNRGLDGGGIWSMVPPRADGRMRTWLTNTIVSDNTNIDVTIYNNLSGSFDVAATRFNLVGAGNTIVDYVTHASSALSATPTDGNILNVPDHQIGLAPLGDYGGPTRTHRLLASSPAIDAGSNSLAVIPFTSTQLTTDQRGTGFPRIVNGTVDIGAYEVGLAKVIDVRLSGEMPNGQPWLRDPYSFAELVPQGKQLAPIYTYGVNKVSIHFSEHVNLAANSLKLWGTGPKNGAEAGQIGHTAFDYDPNTQIASWTFGILGGDKYRIDIEASGVTDTSGNLLDGHWENLFNGTLDIWADDPSQAFPSGNGGAGGSSFQFMFALLPGDYNQDGIVDQADFVVLENPEAAVDGDGNGLWEPEGGDRDVWSTYYFNNGRLPLYKAHGDFLNDDKVDMLDYAIWRATFGSQTDLRADANGNGTIDAADYTLWVYWKNTVGAWHIPTMGIGSTLPIVDFGNAPTVMNVTISGLNSTHDPYSFESHVGSGEQLRTVPVGRADTISITFSEDVNIVASNLRLVGLRTANVPTLVEFAYDMVTMTATWRFDDLVANDHYLISLSDAVTDIEGNRLDGEWVNPATLATTNSLVSEFPSGDGNAGGHFNFVMTLLAGDADLNGIVNGADYYIWSMHWAQDGGFQVGDFDGDGIVGTEDILHWYSTVGINLQTAWALADLNGDSMIDEDDLLILVNNIGMSDPTLADGDLNGDGVIDSLDLELAFAQYGLGFTVAS